MRKEQLAVGFDIEQAKQEYIAWRQSEWRDEWRRTKYIELGYAHPRDVPCICIPKPPLSLEPIAWAVSSWSTGGVVMDMEAVAKLPDSKQKIIFKQIKKFSNK